MTVLMAAGCLLYGALSLILLFVLALSKVDYAACGLVILSAGLAYAAQFGGVLALDDADSAEPARWPALVSVIGTFASVAVGCWAFLRLAF